LLGYIATDNRRFFWAAFILLGRAVFDVSTVRRAVDPGGSVLGADLDSLADVISFGVAPAVLGFTLGLRGGWDMVILTYFVVCGVSRLARFSHRRELTDADTGKVEARARRSRPAWSWSCCWGWRSISATLTSGSGSASTRWDPLCSTRSLIFAASGGAMVAQARIPSLSPGLGLVAK
jgi:CDP-diacylglycerol--serine O-phosphatidyltransferase